MYMRNLNGFMKGSFHCRVFYRTRQLRNMGLGVKKNQFCANTKREETCKKLSAAPEPKLKCLPSYIWCFANGISHVDSCSAARAYLKTC